MKDIDSLLKNLSSIYVTVVMLDEDEAPSFEQMQSCDLFACQLPSPGLPSLFANLLFWQCIIIYVPNSGPNSEQFPAAACAGHQRLDSLDRRTA